MRKITVTEDNFEQILNKLQKICNKHKMFEFRRVFTENMTEEKQYRRNSIGFRDDVKHIHDENGELIDLKSVKKFFAFNKYVRVTKHQFREKFENDKDSYDARYSYPEMKSLIHLDLGAGEAIVISAGDKIQFLPFGWFIIWTDDTFRDFNKSTTIYKNIYFPDFIKGRIKDLEKENSIRDEEWEREEELWYNHLDEDMDYDW